MKSNTNKYSWIPANDLTGIKINNYDIVNNEITIDSSLLIDWNALANSAIVTSEKAFFFSGRFNMRVAKCSSSTFE